MLHTKSESDITSLAPSSPSRSPKRPVYYVQSPSRDSQDGDKSSSIQATPNFRSPMESPSHPSVGRHSRNSSSSRFSGIFRSHSGRKVHRKRNDKGWPECNVIVEEGKYEEYEDEKRVTRRLQALMALLSFIVLFTILCLIIWGAARSYKAEITMKSLVLNSLYIGEGSDSSGVITKMLTINGSLRIGVHNPGTFFGIHVSSTPVNLIYSEIVIATGQVLVVVNYHAYGKDISNPFMAVMICQKSLGYFNTPMIHVLSVELSLCCCWLLYFAASVQVNPHALEVTHLTRILNLTKSNSRLGEDCWDGAIYVKKTEKRIVMGKVVAEDVDKLKEVKKKGRCSKRKMSPLSIEYASSHTSNYLHSFFIYICCSPPNINSADTQAASGYNFPADSGTTIRLHGPSIYYTHLVRGLNANGNPDPSAHKNGGKVFILTVLKLQINEWGFSWSK
ncbi:late embryogenesis abundant protein, LEA-14 [Artemisia annua]|uniref:Late embryogenesis abundant protein, LEA-14 n=1 Tax=Artemisia annua TaxID=35608 RepID=A0A2U1QK50_ARTAN|nr:late embryogenesis abundant protein, LEA-14 [Artemisia annua]